MAAVLRGGIKVEIGLEVTLKNRCAYHLPGEVDMSWPELGGSWHIWEVNDV